jgi:hypothetical protein
MRPWAGPNDGREPILLDEPGRAANGGRPANNDGEAARRTQKLPGIGRE